MNSRAKLTTGYVEVFRRDLSVSWEYVSLPNRVATSVRGEVEELSLKSRARLAWVANNTSVEFAAMITLTYPAIFPKDGKVVKSHLKRFLQRLKRRCGSVSYLWFIEFQRRGAPHFHVLVTKEGGAVGRGWLSKAWFEVVGSRDEKHILAGTRVEFLRSKDGAARYVSKYAYKTWQKSVPEDYRNVGRFWGHSVDVKPKPKGKFDVTCDGEIESLLRHVGVDDVDVERKYRVYFGVAQDVAELLCAG